MSSMTGWGTMATAMLPLETNWLRGWWLAFTIWLFHCNWNSTYCMESMDGIGWTGCKVLIIWICCWRKLHWIVEQPANSCLQSHPRFQELLHAIRVTKRAVWIHLWWLKTETVYVVQTYVYCIIQPRPRFILPSSTWDALVGPPASSTSFGLRAVLCWNLL